MSAAIKANNFADLRAQLTNATDDVVKATEAYWAALPGVIAAKCRHLIDEEIEVRQAVAHDIETAHAALVADMAPPTRWEATR
ncbi:hypothetical protein DKT68_00780 [Micromonospora acroterricola]|uniref:Uncharacterized protein n=1 Tax=Micromonospora acroterricola TaxID=2202421 RepID=A0A317DHI8_9ACTN|nr:hypothetical protein [Micromonospora acroterricola]PWR13660.1 hypothetical protein DKT68_00780 [Micromonospora acroterricola]